MDLEFHKFGSGPPLIILHGLYGSGTNWLNIGRELSKRFSVYLPDLRNHGRSRHNPSHTYENLANDLKEFCQTHKLDSIYLIGHSMGGKAAITFTMQHPGITKKLICVDISPFSYLGAEHFKDQIEFHKNILDTFHSAPIQEATSRKDIDDYFADRITNPQIRKFLLKNLKRYNDGKFHWQLNINTLRYSLEHIVDAVPPVKLGAQSYIPSLFLKGALSPYITTEDIEAISDIFPSAQFETFEKAGHWLHAEYPEKFIQTTIRFFNI